MHLCYPSYRVCQLYTQWEDPHLDGGLRPLPLSYSSIIHGSRSLITYSTCTSDHWKMLTIQIHCTPIYTTEIHTVGAHVCRAITCSSLFYTVSPPYPQLTQALSVMDDFANRNKMSTFRKWDVAILDWREGLRTTTQPHYIIIHQYHWSPNSRDYCNRYSMAKLKRHRREWCQLGAKWM